MAQTASATRGVDGRSSGARRLRKIVRQLSAECGGEDALTMAERELVRAAGLALLRLRDLEALIVGNGTVDDANAVRLLNTAHRLLGAVVAKGRKRAAAGPTLRDYLERKTQDAK